RKRGRLDFVLVTCDRSHREMAVRGAPAAQRLGGGELLDRDRVTALAERADGVTPLLRGHVALLLEGDPEHGACGLVVEDQGAALVDEEGGGGEAGEEIPSEDQLERLLCHCAQVSRMLAAGCAKGVAGLEPVRTPAQAAGGDGPRQVASSPPRVALPRHG